MKLKPEDIEEIIRMRKNGATLREISTKFGISKRRVLQVLKSGNVKRPGRKPLDLPEHVRELILELRGRGYTIDRIHQCLREKGFNVSRYLVWKTLKEEELKKTGLTLHSMLERWDTVIALMLFGITANKKYKILLVIEVPSCKVISHMVKCSIRITDAIELLDRNIKGISSKRVLLLISRVPPLVPTRSCTNRLIKHLRNMNWGYRWIPRKEFRRVRRVLSDALMREPVEDFPRWFETTGVRIIEKNCRWYLKTLCKIAGGDENEHTEEVEGPAETGK